MKPKKLSASAPATPARASSMPPPTNDQIAALAYAIWLDQGRPEGRDQEHWLEAERQLRGVAEPLVDQRVDVDLAPAARIDRELDRIVSPPGQRSPTSL